MSTKIRYHKLARSFDSGEGEVYSPLQFKKSEPKVPVRSIVISCILFLIGSILITIGALLLSGHIDTKYSDRTWPVLVLGCITFIPGAYHFRIAVWAYFKYPGYSFDDIPSYND